MKRKHMVGMVIKWKKSGALGIEETTEKLGSLKKISVHLKDGNTTEGELLGENKVTLILLTSCC